MTKRRTTSPEERARLDREAAALDAIGPARTWRIINGLGTEYRVTATSAGNAIRAFNAEHRIPGVRLHDLRVLENGAWIYVL